MAHDFKKFPELTNRQFEIYYWESPHKQITESFSARCVEVHDGDTIKVEWIERNFPFSVRFANVAAPELDEEGGEEARSWLENRILDQEIDIIVDPDNRVGKWGRLIGTIVHGGQDVGEEQIMLGLGSRFGLGEVLL